jgi:uncharacterized membrane protein
MNKEDVLKVLLAAVLSAIIKPLVEAFMPSKELVKVYIKKGLYIAFGYLLPFGMLLNLFFGSNVVNKTFVFQVMLFSLSLLFNLLLELIDKLRANQIAQRDDIIESIKIVISEFTELHQNHLDLTKETIGYNKEIYSKISESITGLQDKVKAIEGIAKKK